VVEGERIEHFAHIEADFIKGTIGEFGDLSQHRVVVYVDFDEGVVFSIYERKVAICAAIRTAIRDGNEFVVGSTADFGTEFAVESIDERGCPANHQDLLAFWDYSAGSGGIGNISLAGYGFDLCGGKKLNNSLCFAGIGDFIPN
jgi:hypothetical protein